MGASNIVSGPMFRVLRVGLVVGLMVALTTTAAADEKKTKVPPSNEAKSKPLVTTDEHIRSQPFMTFSHSGYLRMRGDVFIHGHLGNAAGGLKEPLEGDSASTANLRMRWRPELKLGQKHPPAAMVMVMVPAAMAMVGRERLPQ